MSRTVRRPLTGDLVQIGTGVARVVCASDYGRSLVVVGSDGVMRDAVRSDHGSWVLA